jgi:hypothetical protein
VITALLKRASTAALGVVLLATGGCMVSESRPQPRLEPIQAQRQIAQEELLDVVVHPFDPGIPTELADDDEALAKKRIYPELRRAEARYLPVLLRNTLESSAQWGTVRVAPPSAEFVDVRVEGTIAESNGKRLALDITVRDATGRLLIDGKRYEGEADFGAYKTDAALKARDPFQNVYSSIANDLVAARERLTAAERREIRQVSELRFAGDLVPEAAAGYLVERPAARNAPALLRIGRLPATDDPLMERVARIRERDAAVVDTLDGYYAGFAEQMQLSYGSFRRTSWEEIDEEERKRSSARMRTALGAAAVAASIFAPGNCGSYQSCNLQSAARTGAAIGGVASILSGIRKYADARTHAQAFRELAESFQAEVEPQVVDVEGRSLKLTGSTEEQYREWRRLLREFHQQETGAAAGS